MPDRKEIELDIAILGGGFAGVYCARALKKKPGRKHPLRIGLIADKNYMVFQPLLPEVIGGSVSPRHVVNPLRLLCRGVEVLKGDVKSIDWPRRRLVLSAGDFTGNFTVSFQQLVLAPGAEIDLRRIPGMPEHAYLMQNAGDAMQLRSAIISRIEEANLEMRHEVKRRLLTFVVVGGGYSGVETAGQILDLLYAIHPYYSNVSREDLQVCLVHGGEHLLPTMSRKLADYTAHQLRQRGLRLVLNERVESVTAQRACLKSGEIIETNTVICTVGNAPHPLVASLCGQNNLPTEKGRVVTGSNLRVKGQTELWAAGDCAAVPYAGGGWCPPTAQFAMRQGMLLGSNINRVRDGKSPEPFTFQGLGELASIGYHRAVAEIMGVNFSGLFAWWLWRTIYLGKLPGIDRKLRVVIDWTLETFLPRDINLLSPRYSRVLKEIHLDAGSTLFHPGEPAFSLYVVKSGRIDLIDDEGVSQTVGAGEYFGERALLGDGHWHFEAQAAEPTVLVSVPAATFHQIVQGSGSLGRLFQKSAAKHQSREIIKGITERLPRCALERPAADVMESDVMTLHPDMPVDEAIQICRTHPHSTYPVLNGDHQVLGVIQREDFHEFLQGPGGVPNAKLRDIPFLSLPKVPADAPVARVMEKIIRAGANKALVVGDDDRLRGMITLMDLVAEEKKFESVGHETPAGP